VKEKEQEVRSLNNQLKTAQQDTGSSSKKIAELQDEFNKKMQSKIPIPLKK
jgi:chaperonin cofactor prefoldin